MSKKIFTPIDYVGVNDNNLTNNSLVSKAFVYSAIASAGTNGGGGSVTSSNGITKSGDNIKLGGTLIENTIINGNSGTYDFTLSNIDLFATTANSITTNAGSWVLTQDSSRYRVQQSGTSRFEMTSGGNIELYNSGNGNSILLNDNNIVLEYNANNGKFLTINATGIIVEDNDGSKGIEYAADYSSTYTNRSLVDKAYVYAAIASAGTNGGSSYTFENGLIETVGVVKLGGTLTESVSIDLNSNTLDIIGNGTINLTSDQNITIGNINDNDYSYLYTAGSSKNIEIATGVNAGNYTSINFYENSIIVASGNPTFAGIEYVSDFSANFTNRSLVDAEYVINAIINAGTNAGENGWTLNGTSTATGNINIVGNSSITLEIQNFDLIEHSVSNGGSIFGQSRIDTTGLVRSWTDGTINWSEYLYPTTSIYQRNWTDGDTLVWLEELDPSNRYIITYTGPVVFRYNDDTTSVQASFNGSATAANMGWADGLAGRFTEINLNEDITISAGDSVSGDNTSILINPTDGISISLSNSGIFAYDSDYSANFTNRSLVDKEYVDNAIYQNSTSGGVDNIYNSNGTLTSNRTISGGGFDLTFNNINNVSILSNGGGANLKDLSSGGVYIEDIGSGGVYIDSDGGGIYIRENSSGGIYIEDTGQGSINLTSDGGGISISDSDGSSVSMSSQTLSGDTFAGISASSNASMYAGNTLGDGQITLTITPTNGLTVLKSDSVSGFVEPFITYQLADIESFGMGTAGWGMKTEYVITNNSNESYLVGTETWKYTNATLNSESANYEILGSHLGSLDPFMTLKGISKEAQFYGPIKNQSYTFAGLPTASEHTGATAYASDLQSMVYSDGSIWNTIGGGNNGDFASTSGYALAAKVTQSFSMGISSSTTITTGAKGRYPISYNGKIVAWRLIAGASCNVVLDIWKSNNAIPTNANSIFGTKPSLTDQELNSATGLNIAVAKGDIFILEVESNDVALYLKIDLEIESF